MSPKCRNSVLLYEARSTESGTTEAQSAWMDASFQANVGFPFKVNDELNRLANASSIVRIFAAIHTADAILCPCSEIVVYVYFALSQA